ncbi:beta-ketoacyl synthase N-terminal-like domain-containing protein [Micromonospora sp. NPDC018662]|uniref:beta-ketoacyl synthase N-terminal-like domain-containing protein n=1 Tax=Micromonospora sp. NPDC018662 TaxID=3364238 RepID=UPI0037ACCD7F
MNHDPRSIDAIDDENAVAVVGLSCRFGAAGSADQLWALLEQGRSAIRRYPVDDLVRMGHDPAAVRRSDFVPVGVVLDDADAFDAEFFGYSPLHAEWLDPQQRVLLETGWHALEDAGFAPDRTGLRTAVFVSVGQPTLPPVSIRELDAAGMIRFSSSDKDFAASRISYKLGLTGPSLTVQTACSSGLVAVHTAVESLLGEECDLALVGAASLHFPQAGYRAPADMILSPSGECRPFDDTADGTVFGNGVGAVVLRRLADAMRDGDPIRAVIRGSAVNNDGARKMDYHAPSPQGQEAVLREALAVAGVDPRSVGYLETHGTGTPLGDPVEYAALDRVYGADRPDPAAIGSVKSVVGHLNTAAGIAGLIKAVLVLEHATVPPQAPYRVANRNLRDTGGLRVAPAADGWPVPAGPRRAGVSSFGIGGTNAHLVLEQAPDDVPVAVREPAPDTTRWAVLSARTDRDLRALAASLADALTADGERRLVDVAWTLRYGRSHRAVRTAVPARTTTELARRLADLAQHGADAVPAGPDDPFQSWVRGQADLPDDPTLAGGRRTRLPGYPFARRVWPRTGTSGPGGETVADRVDGVPPGAEQRTVRPEEVLVADHRVGGVPVLPAAVQIDLALTAARRHDRPAAGLADVAFHRPLAVTAPVTLDVTVDGPQVRVRSTELHASATVLAAAPDDPAPAPLDLDALRAEHADLVAPDELYRRFAANAVDYGPSFRVLRELRQGPSGALTHIVCPPADDGTVSPFVLDGALQSVIGCLRREDLGGETFVPFAVEQLLVHAEPPDDAWVLVRPHRLAGGGQRIRKYDLTVTDTAGAVRLTLRGLALRPVTGVAPLADVHLFTAVERAVAEPDGSEPEPDGPVVLLGDADPEWAGLVLRAPADPAEAETVGTEVAARVFGSGRPVIVWPLADGAAHADPADTATAAGLRMLALLRSLLRPLARRGARIVVPYRTDAAAGSVTAAGLAALGRSLAGENHRFDLTAVGRSGGEPDWSAVVRAATTAAAPAHQMVIGVDGVPRTPTLRPVVLPAAGGPAFRRGGRYWINGMGRLAVLVAEHLIDHYAARVVLTGRSAAEGARGEELHRLGERAARAGGSVDYHRLDCTDRAAVGEVAHRLAASGPPVNGVLHCAGVLRDSYLLRTSVAAARDVIAPKLVGAAALDAATADWSLDCFVVFSSVSAALGSPGQADYAFGNAAADELVRRRAADRSRGGRSLSVAWPFWADGGMLPAEPVRQVLGDLGMRALPTAAGLAVLESLLAGSVDGGQPGPAPATVVLCGDRAALTASFPLLEDDRPATGPADRPTPTGGRTPTRAVGAESVGDALHRRLRAVVSEATRVPLDELAADRLFDDLGIDSLLAIRVVELLEQDFGRLSKTLLFECRSVAELADHLLQEYPERCVALTGAPDATPVVVPTEDPAAVEAPRRADTTAEDRVDPRAVAVIGVSGRFPQAGNLDALWENLRDGRDSITEVPTDRWDADALHSPDKSRVDRTYAKWGGFLDGVQDFDAGLFHISPREAGIIDPQSRLFLESCWAALEDAGYTPDHLVPADEPAYRRDVGVFVGAMYGEYQLHEAEERLRGNPVLANSAYWSIANRVSYYFDFQGPSVAVDTACSAALTAVHLAVESLRAGSCRVAVAGGVNVLIHPNKYFMLSQGRFASSDGRCRSFGAGGDGYVPGEGVGAVVLKPLRDALRDGDHLHGVLRGTAVNHGGRTNGYTVPSPRAQANLITKALRDGGLTAGDLDYVETHGTGTPLGDPIEIRGLVTAFAADGVTGPGRLPIGSVKSNVGHLESAAGAVALAKVLLQLRHRTLVPSLHASPPNPEIDFDRIPFAVQQEVAPWRTRDGSARPLRAGISSFGAGGANAHLIVEEPPGAPPRAAVDGSPPMVLFLSARTDRSLAAYARTLRDHLVRVGGQDDAPGVADVVFTFAVGRVELARRAALRADSWDTMLSELNAVAEGRPASSPVGGAGTAVADWLAGGRVDRAAVSGAAGRGRRVSLPHYPFERVRCWYDVQIAHLHQQGLGSAGREPELARPHLRDFGRRLDAPDPTGNVPATPAAEPTVAPAVAPAANPAVAPVAESAPAPPRTAAPTVAASVPDTVPRSSMTNDQKIVLRSLGAAETSTPPAPRPADPRDRPPTVAAPARSTPPRPAPTAVPEAAVTAEITRLLAAVLYQEIDELDVEQTFLTLGVDSILGVEFVSAVSAAYPVEVKITALYDHPTPAAFARHVTALLGAAAPPPVEPAAPAPSVPVPAVTPTAAPSRDVTEVAAVLREELARTLYCDPAEIDDDTSFNALGLDSILGVEFVTFVNDRYALDEPAGVLYDHPTLTAFARHVAAGRATGGSSPQPSPAGDLDALLDAVRDNRLTVDEALVQLARP